MEPEPTQPAPPPREPDRRPERRPTRILSTLILVAVLLLILVIGFLAVDTILAIRRPVANAPGAIGTRVQEVINPTPTIIADSAAVVRSVQSLARLETASYTIEKVITAESGSGPLGFLFQDKLLLVAQGQVIAGVDLARLQREDVQVVGETVYITLPASEIFVATLNNDETYVYDRQTGVLGQQIDLETLARQEAEAEILDAALEDGILDLAQDNAEGYVEGLMRGLGFAEVIFTQATPAPNQNRDGAPTPES
jgi:hypothetical protein